MGQYGRPPLATAGLLVNSVQLGLLTVTQLLKTQRLHNGSSAEMQTAHCPVSAAGEICYSNTTAYYGIQERSKCIPVDSGVTNLIYDRRRWADFTLEVEANVARCVHSSMNKPGVKRNSGL